MTITGRGVPFLALGYAGSNSWSISKRKHRFTFRARRSFGETLASRLDVPPRGIEARKER